MGRCNFNLSFMIVSYFVLVPYYIQYDGTVICQYLEYELSSQHP